MICSGCTNSKDQPFASVKIMARLCTAYNLVFKSNSAQRDISYFYLALNKCNKIIVYLQYYSGDQS